MKEQKYGKGTGKGEHIINYDKFIQPVLFDEIGTGPFRPTDYDSVIEVDNKYWFAFEVKERGKRMPTGQSLSYTRTADKWEQCGDVAYVFVVEHDIRDESQPIMLKDCTIAEVYHKGKWKYSKHRKTVMEALQLLAKKYKITKLKNK